MSKLAEAIAHEEGFFIPGSLPNRNNNPGDLRHSPHSFHTGDPNSIGAIDTVADGWADLERQLGLYAARGLTVEQCIYEYAPPGDNNDSAAYLAYVCKYVGCSPSDLVSTVLTKG